MSNTTNPNARPTPNQSETLDAYFRRLDTWKEQGEWVPASGGTEVPFVTRTGARLLYCWQMRSGKHAYLNCDTDLILSESEANALLGV